MQNTSNNDYILGVMMTIFYIWTLKFLKKPSFRGPICTGL